MSRKDRLEQSRPAFFEEYSKRGLTIMEDLNSLARRNEVALKIVLDKKTSMKNSFIGHLIICSVYKRG